MKELIPKYKLILVREQGIRYEHRVNTIDDAISLLSSLGLADAPEEHLYMLCLDTRGNIIAMHEISHGTLASAPVSIRAVFSRALLNNAATILVAHNHPSGDPKPSSEDISITEKIRSAGELLELPLLDHIIIGMDSTCSMKQSGHI